MNKKNIFLFACFILVGLILLGVGLALSGVNIFNFIFSKTSLLIAMILLIVLLEVWRRSREK